MARWTLIICLVLAVFSQINANGTVKVRDVIQNKMQSTADLVKQQTTMLKDTVGQKKAGLLDRVKTDELLSVLDGLQGKLDGLTSIAGFVLDAAITTAVATIKTAVGEIKNLVGQIGGILDAVFTALDGVLQLVANLLGAIVNILGNALKSLLGSLGDVLNGLLVQVKSLADGLINRVQDVLHLQLSNINNAVDTILDVLEPKVLGDVVNTLSQVVASALAAVFCTLARAGNLIGYLLDALVHEVFGLLSTVGAVLNKVLSSVFDTLGGTLQALVGGQCSSCLNGALGNGNGGGILLGRRRRNTLY